MGGTWYSALAVDIEQNRTAYANAVNDQVQQEVPELFTGTDRARLARASTAGLLDAFAEHLRLRLESGFHAPPSAIALARHLAQSGVPLPSLLRAYRIGQAALFQRAAQLVAESDPSDPEASVAELGAIMFRLNDEAMVDVTEEWERQREALMYQAISKRDSLIRALLSGSEVDLPAAEHTLGYRLDGIHVACIGWADSDSSLGALEQTVRQALKALGGGDCLLVPRSGSELMAWSRLPGAPSDERLEAARAIVAQEPQTRLALGSAAASMPGFAQTGQQAEVARVVASLSTGPQLVSYSQVALASLLLDDVDAARKFAAEELGPLAAASGQAAELRATLSVYLSVGQDQTATANALHVHRNTVIRRLAQVQEQLPHPLANRWRELAAALTILEWLGRETAEPAPM